MVRYLDSDLRILEKAGGFRRPSLQMMTGMMVSIGFVVNGRVLPSTLPMIPNWGTLGNSHIPSNRTVLLCPCQMKYTHLPKIKEEIKEYRTAPNLSLRLTTGVLTTCIMTHSATGGGVRALSVAHLRSVMKRVFGPALSHLVINNTDTGRQLRRQARSRYPRAPDSWNHCNTPPSPRSMPIPQCIHSLPTRLAHLYVFPPLCYE